MPKVWPMTSSARCLLPFHLFGRVLPGQYVGNRPVFMWIHGGGFTGGKRTRYIIEMAEYYVAGWVFVSIDYRTTEELCDSEEMDTCKGKVAALAQNDPDDVIEFYRGLHLKSGLSSPWPKRPTPSRSSSRALPVCSSGCQAALRWIVANANTYGINTDYITVGGNSAGSVTTIALGISNRDDFRDEVSLKTTQRFHPPTSVRPTT